MTIIRRRATIGIVFGTVFLDLLGFGMVLPLMPLYAVDPRFNATPAEIGWLMAIFSIMQFLFAPFWGRLSDRIGRRPVLIIGLFGSSLSYLVYGLAQTLTVLFFARAGAGIMGATIAAAQAAMSDLTPREGRARAMGLIGAAFGLGFLLGPALGGLLSRFGPEIVPLVAAFITGLNGVAALFFLGETRTALPSATATGQPPFHPLSRHPWKSARQFPGALAMCLLMGGYILLFAAFEVTMPLWGAEFPGWTMAETAWVFAFVGLVMVVVQGGLVRQLASRLGEKRIAATGLLLVAAGLAFFPTGGTATALIALAFIAVGAGMVHPGLSSLVSLNTDPEQQGQMMGLFQSMSALGRSVGPVAGGGFYGVVKGVVFPVAAVGTLALFLIFLFLLRHKVQDTRQDRPPAPSPTAP